MLADCKANTLEGVIGWTAAVQHGMGGIWDSSGETGGRRECRCVCLGRRGGVWFVGGGSDEGGGEVRGGHVVRQRPGAGEPGVQVCTRS